MDLRKGLAGTYRDLHGPLGSAAAAEVVVPRLLALLAPTSVLDVGCGVGSFVHEFLAAGVDDVVGVDAAEFDDALLVMPVECLRVVDLREPLDLGRRFDVVLCLEVGGYLADHDRLVASLVAHGPVVVFSSAVPGQDLRHQQHGAYLSAWAERFAAVGYELVDPFRALWWTDARLPFWFRQNLVMFVERDHLRGNAALSAAASAGRGPVDVIHPELYELLAGTGPSASLRLTLVRLGPLLRSKAIRLAGRFTPRYGRRPRPTA